MQGPLRESHPDLKPSVKDLEAEIEEPTPILEENSRTLKSPYPAKPHIHTSSFF
jgi:hypothetical protein